jgi:hypothetical protein
MDAGRTEMARRAVDRINGWDLRRSDETAARHRSTADPGRPDFVDARGGGG